MGTPVKNPDPEYGNDCPLCRPDPWPPGLTPKFVYAYFEGMINCPACAHTAPNGHTFLLEQSPINWCMWDYSGANFFCEFHPVGGPFGMSLLHLYCTHGFTFFVDLGPGCPPTNHIYDNTYVNCVPLLGAAKGKGLICWGSFMLDLVKWFGLQAGNDLMLENFLDSNRNVYYKFCDLYQRTNIKFKLSP